MALYKRSPGGPWWTRFTVRGKPIRRSTGTADRSRAEEYETALRARFWRQTKLGEDVHTWREAVQRFKREAMWKPSTRRRNEDALVFFERLNQVAVGAITADVCRAAREFVERSQSPSSANRIMAVFRGLLHQCVKWGWITHAPPVYMAHVPDKDPVWLSPAECEALLLELPEHTRAPALFSALVGFRMANTRDLKWSQIDFNRAHITIPSSHYKSSRPQGFPLSPEAVQLLRAVPRVSEYVFTYRGKKIAGTFNTKAFRLARARAGLTCRWHDLRHTFASWLASQGASDRVLQAMGGWASNKMPAKYAHLRSDDLRPWALAVGTNAVTALKILEQPKCAKKPIKIVVPEIGVEPTTFALRMPKARKKAK
jgi:integrase